MLTTVKSNEFPKKVASLSPVNVSN